MKINILLVDDSAIVRGMIGRVLKMTDIPIACIRQAGNGLEAQAILRDNWIDLVISDIHMPGMDGLALLQWMREDPTLAKTPVLMISTEANEAKVAEAKHLGVVAYLRKPFTPEQVKEVVLQALGVVHG